MRNPEINQVNIMFWRNCGNSRIAIDGACSNTINIKND